MSAIKFWMSGNTPPPTTIIMNIPEACAVYLPRPSVARLNIDAHITEVQSPQSTRNKALSGTTVISNELPVKSGMEAVIVFGDIMARTTRTMPAPDVHSISTFDDTLSAIKPEMNRPTSISNQYVPATKPPMAAALAMIPAPLSLVSAI